MTIISSGGFLPVNDISIIVNSNFKEIIFSILMLFSYFSLFLIYNVLFLKKKSLNFFAEDIYLSLLNYQKAKNMELIFLILKLLLNFRPNLDLRD